MGLEFFQIVFGITLVIISGYALSLVIFKKGDIDFVERVVFIPILGLLVPSLILLFINLAMRIRIDPLVTYLTFILIIGVSLGYPVLIKKEKLYF
ncbi:hypothetical protein HY991_00170 [Candidatus Micrarchaeota archaeon]|nr:hypothetical protein [Candidatus Micrarchaeota archaeon]